MIMFSTTLRYESVDNNMIFNVTKEKYYHMYWTIMRVDMYVSVEWDK